MCFHHFQVKSWRRCKMIRTRKRLQLVQTNSSINLFALNNRNKKYIYPWKYFRIRKILCSSHNIYCNYKQFKKYDLLFINTFKMLIIGKLRWYKRNKTTCDILLLDFIGEHTNIFINKYTHKIFYCSEILQWSRNISFHHTFSSHLYE